VKVVNKKFCNNMSKKCPHLKLNKWQFLRIIIDKKTKIIKVRPIPGEEKFIIKTKKRIIVLLLRVKTAL
jgi:hypothetical protein